MSLPSLYDLKDDKGNKIDPFDGDHFSAPISAKDPLPGCNHKGKTTYDREKSCLRCQCGVIFTGPNLAQLHKLLI